MVLLVHYIRGKQSSLGQYVRTRFRVCRGNINWANLTEMFMGVLMEDVLTRCLVDTWLPTKLKRGLKGRSLLRVLNIRDRVDNTLYLSSFCEVFPITLR